MYARVVLEFYCEAVTWTDVFSVFDLETFFVIIYQVFVSQFK